MSHLKIILCIVSCLLALLGCLILLVTKRILRTFGRITLNQVLIHISMPRELIPDDFFKRLLNTGWKSLVVFAFLAIYCLVNILACNHEGMAFCANAAQNILKFFCLDNWFAFIYRKPQITLLCFSFFLLVFSLLYSSIKLDILKSLLAHGKFSSIFEDFYVENNVKDYKRPDGKEMDSGLSSQPNLVLIVCESLETTFANPALFHEDLIKELSQYRKPGNHIEDLYMVQACNCTITSLYALQYGVPILYFSSHNGDPLKQNPFLGKCHCIFDVLNANGYTTEHLQGADLRFANHDALYRPITNGKILGNYEIPTEEYSNRRRWGLWDSDLVEIAKKEILALNDKGPFALSLLTLDTHFDNVLQPNAERKYHGDMRDILRLQSKLIGGLINWIQNSPFGPNTVIALLGDHYMMAEKVGNVNLAKQNSRRIFNFILNSKAKNPLAPQRQAAVFDFAPTILEALGFEWPSHALGLGRSLYQDSPTIIEQCDGLETWEKEAQKKSKKYLSIIS